MTKKWIDFLTKIETEILSINKRGSDIICFRGQANKTWDLLPTLFLKKKSKRISNEALWQSENALYFDFVTNAGTLLKSNFTDWEILFEMRHHGNPTRLLIGLKILEQLYTLR